MSRVKLQDRRVLITGCSSGIGSALAREVARRGARLAVVARRQALLEELADEIESQGMPRPAVIVADLSKRGAAAELAVRADSELGGVDILINNAGGGVGGSQWAVGDRDEARDAFEINFWSPLALTRALVPGMLERGAGAVVNVTSMGRVMTWAGMGHYCATKAAFGTATETLRLELTGTGIHVMEVIPGPTDTATQGETRLVPGISEALKRSPLGQPEELARLIVRGLERRRSVLVYPRLLGAAYFLPSATRWYVRLMTSRLEREPGYASIRQDPRVVRSGSMGDDEAREARAAWEQEHREQTHVH